MLSAASLLAAGVLSETCGTLKGAFQTQECCPSLATTSLVAASNTCAFDSVKVPTANGILKPESGTYILKDASKVWHFVSDATELASFKTDYLINPAAEMVYGDSEVLSLLTQKSSEHSYAQIAPYLSPSEALVVHMSSGYMASFPKMASQPALMNGFAFGDPREGGAQVYLPCDANLAAIFPDEPSLPTPRGIAATPVARDAVTGLGWSGVTVSHDHGGYTAGSPISLAEAMPAGKTKMMLSYHTAWCPTCVNNVYGKYFGDFSRHEAVYKNMEAFLATHAPEVAFVTAFVSQPAQLFWRAMVPAFIPGSVLALLPDALSQEADKAMVAGLYTALGFSETTAATFAGYVVDDWLETMALKNADGTHVISDGMTVWNGVVTPLGYTAWADAGNENFLAGYPMGSSVSWYNDNVPSLYVGYEQGGVAPYNSPFFPMNSNSNHALVSDGKVVLSKQGHFALNLNGPTSAVTIRRFFNALDRAELADVWMARELTKEQRSDVDANGYYYVDDISLVAGVKRQIKMDGCVQQLDQCLDA
jgi:hypothetical protein